jgi:diguanylate cyclase (GGDEF)-like protein
VHVPYSYTLFLLGVLALVSRFFSDVAAYRAQIFGVVLSAFIVFLANLAYTQGGVTLAGLDPSPALAAVFSLGVGISVFRGFLSLQPLSYRAVFMAMDGPVMLIDPHGFIVDANPSAEQLAGLRLAPGMHLERFLPWVSEGDAMLRHAGQTFSVKWVELAGGSGTEGGRALVLHDTTAEVRHRQMLETMARQDSLTQALNRGAFESLLQQQLEQRREEWPLAILFLDLNDFKGVNDSLGHAAGDEVLRELARRVQGVLRPGDLLARLGGDEFTVLLDRADASIAHAVGQRIADRLREPFQLGERQLVAGASIGHAIWPEDGSTFEALLDSADRRMYEIKRGRDGDSHADSPEIS